MPPAAASSALTAMAPIRAGQLDALKQALAAASALPPEHNPLVRVSTVHFARWVIFDNESRLLFASNFDGPWDAYLDDFIDNGGEGLDAIFGNCEGYPQQVGSCKTNPDGFKRYVRDHELKNELSYCAYPDATVKEILKALEVRRGLRAVLAATVP